MLRKRPTKTSTFGPALRGDGKFSFFLPCWKDGTPGNHNLLHLGFLSVPVD